MLFIFLSCIFYACRIDVDDVSAHLTVSLVIGGPYYTLDDPEPQVEMKTWFNKKYDKLRENEAVLSSFIC